MFSTVHEQPSGVINKYLQGVPYKNDFPGPFNIQGQLPRDGPPMSKELTEQYPPPSCTQYGSESQFVTPPNMVATPPSMTASIQEGNVTQSTMDRNHYGENSRFIPPSDKQPKRAYYIEKERRPKIIEEFKDSSLSDPENETGFGQVVPTFIQNHYEEESGDRKWCPPWSPNNPLVDIKNRPNDQFSHNNMVPFYGANVTQNMASTGVPQAGDNNDCRGNTTGYGGSTPNRGILESYTGRDEAYMHKREVGPMFSPAEQQTGWVYGTPGFRPNLDQFRQDIRIKNNETPVEKLQVGPGIATDYNVPAVGGFQQFTRILPNNVNNYKANQLEGRVGGGKWQYSNKPTSQFTEGVPNNRPKEYVTQARRPTMQGKFFTNATDAGTARMTDQVLTTLRGKQARTETEVSGGFGQLEPKNGSYCLTFGDAPVGRAMKSNVPKITMNRGTFEKLRETFKKGAAGTTTNGEYWQCNDMTQGQERWDLLGGGSLPVSQTVTREGWYVNETDRGDLNPYSHINASGTQYGGKWNPLSYTDQQKVTRKETTQFAYQGNVGGMSKQVAPIEDQQRVTRKETTMFAHQGNAAGDHMKEMIRPQDQMKTTRTETTMFAHQGNAVGSHAKEMNRSFITGN